MSPPARRTLRDSDQDAITQPDTTTGPGPIMKPVGGPAQAKAPAATRSTTATTRTGLYFHAATFEAAESAYLVDLDELPDSADSFA